MCLYVHIYIYVYVSGLCAGRCFCVRVYTYVSILWYISVCLLLFADACLVCVYLATHECTCINLFGLYLSLYV